MRSRSPWICLALALCAAHLPAAPASAQWGVEGVKATTSALGIQYNPVMVADGSGGCIVVWEDTRAGAGEYDLYAQRFDAAGVRQWTATGVVVCDFAGDQIEAQVCTDDAGGAIVVWRDFRGGATSDIYAQRITAAGAADWTEDGKLICNAANNQEEPAIVEDSFGGAIMAWTDWRSGNR